MSRIVLFLFSLGLLLHAQSQAELLKIYDRYIAASRAKDLNSMATLMTGARQAQFRLQTRTPADRQAALQMIAFMTPQSYQPLFVSKTKDGKKATLMLIATVTVPPEIQRSQKLPATQHLEVTVDFYKEAGTWKMEPPGWGTDPAQRKRPSDLNMGTRDDYQPEANTNLGGLVLSVAPQPLGTVLIIRMLDEENAVLIPASLMKPAFVPGALVSMMVAQSKTDPLKYWAEQAKLHDE